MNLINVVHWQRLWQVSRASGDPLPWYNQLVAAYSEPHRFYHNLRHIAECLAELDASRHLAKQPIAVKWALWFHDAVYETKASDNEQQSAQLAERCLSQARLDRVLVQTVVELILATQHRGSSIEVDAPLVVDIDLSILGQPDERFFEYERQIRQEYAWVPQATFAQKRVEILEGFLARPRLYATDWFYHKYEQPARRNLQHSLRLLNPSKL